MVPLLLLTGLLLLRLGYRLTLPLVANHWWRWEWRLFIIHDSNTGDLLVLVFFTFT
jgi:hypothetical protein